MCQLLWWLAVGHHQSTCEWLNPYLDNGWYSTILWFGCCESISWYSTIIWYDFFWSFLYMFMIWFDIDWWLISVCDETAENTCETSWDHGQLVSLFELVCCSSPQCTGARGNCDHRLFHICVKKLGSVSLQLPHNGKSSEIYRCHNAFVILNSYKFMVFFQIPTISRCLQYTNHVLEKTMTAGRFLSLASGLVPSFKEQSFCDFLGYWSSG